MNGNDQQQRPEIPIAGVVYGDTIYWGTIVAAIITIVGSVVSFVTTANYLDPAYMLSGIWEGKDVYQIWETAVGSTPDGHWYLGQLATGNGLTMAGIALGVFIVAPAIVASAVVLLKERKTLYGMFALIAALITTKAMIPGMGIPMLVGTVVVVIVVGALMMMRRR